MKLFIHTTIAFLVLQVSSINAKSQLTPEEQEHLMDQLAKDRLKVEKQVMVPFGKLFYDPSLEAAFDGLSANCDAIPENITFTPLKYNKAVHVKIEYGLSKSGSPSLDFFRPESYRIGCSKAFKCSMKYRAGGPVPKEVDGKIGKISGGCAISLGWNEGDWKLNRKISKLELPPASKYGNILGIPEPTD